MKNLILLLAAALCSHAVNAQGATETAIEFKKQNPNGVTAKYEFSEDYTRPVVFKKLAEAGLENSRRESGFQLYREENWKDIAPTTIDVYVEVKGSGSSSIVNIILSKGYDNYMSSACDAVAIDRLKTFLNNLAADIAEYKKQQDLIAQQKEVEAARKKLEATERQNEKERLEKEKKLNKEKRELEKIKKE